MIKKIITILYLLIAMPVLAASNLWEYSIETGAPFLSFKQRKIFYETRINTKEEYKGTIKQNNEYLRFLYGNNEENEEMVFGAQNAVGGETYYLSGSGISATQTTINLTKFGYTKPDGTYQKFTMDNFGSLGCGTVQPGNSSGKQEFVSFTGITQNSDNTAQLTGISRGLERFSPYSASTTLRTSHTGGSTFVVSNSPPCFYENYVTINNAETISAVKTFASTTAPKYDAGYTASGNEFVSFTQLNSVVIAGAGTSTEAALGLVRLATKSQQAASTASSTSGAPLVLTSREADATYDSAKSNQVVITGADNTIDAGYIATSSNYSWSGTHNFTGTTYVKNLNASSSASNPAYLNGIDYAFPVTEGASSTVLATNGSGSLSWVSQTTADWSQLSESIIESATSTMNLDGFAARKDLKLVIQAVGFDADSGPRYFRFNGSGSGYSSSYSTNRGSLTQDETTRFVASLASTSPFYLICDIRNETSVRKAINCSGVVGTGGSTLFETWGLWNNTSAQITNVQLYTSTDTFTAGSRMTIYGKKD